MMNSKTRLLPTGLAKNNVKFLLNRKQFSLEYLHTFIAQNSIEVKFSLYFSKQSSHVLRRPFSKPSKVLFVLKTLLMTLTENEPKLLPINLK